jgi:hypothetical protein
LWSSTWIDAVVVISWFPLISIGELIWSEYVLVVVDF